jgi:acetyl esterase
MGGGTRDGAECRAARIIVAGDSAGGTLAAATSLRLRDVDGPPLCGQLLLYPVTDYHAPGTPSYEDNAEGYGLTRDTMKWFWDHYLNDPSEELCAKVGDGLTG